MKLVSYLRVSGTSQANDGFGLATQRDGIADWAVKNDHQIVLEIQDAGVSGTREGLSRPGFHAAVEAIESNVAEGFIAYDMTRIARALIIQEAALQILWDAGATIFTVGDGLVDSNDKDGTRTFVRQVMGAFAEYQRASLVDKAREGKLRAKAAGRHTDGLAPFGWKIEDKQLVLDSYGQDILGKIEMYREMKRSWKWIADFLNNNGLSTAGGGKWYEASVYRVVKRAKEMQCKK